MPLQEATSLAPRSLHAPWAPVRNRLIGTLDPTSRAAVEADMETVRLEHRAVLFEPEQPIRHVYFPETAVISLVTMLENGSVVEVGTAGCEGMGGLPVFLGGDTSTNQAIAQVPGMAARMESGVFMHHARSPGRLHDLMLRYTQAFLTQVAQTAACNGAHLVEERCARWLLMTHDRVEGDEFPLTHEFLAFMLSVRRAGVTLAMRALQDKGVVRYTRGRVAISDRLGLERLSCECYRVVKAHFNRLLPAH